MRRALHYPLGPSGAGWDRASTPASSSEVQLCPRSLAEAGDNLMECFANTWQGNTSARYRFGQRRHRGEEVTCPVPLSEAESEPTLDLSSSRVQWS